MSLEKPPALINTTDAYDALPVSWMGWVRLNCAVGGAGEGGLSYGRAPSKFAVYG
jgi:hypothetical protein